MRSCTCHMVPITYMENHAGAWPAYACSACPRLNLIPSCPRPNFQLTWLPGAHDPAHGNAPETNGTAMAPRDFTMYSEANQSTCIE